MASPLRKQNQATLRAVALATMAAPWLAAAGPCDIYAAGGTPCAVAHSTTRALFSNYKGPLYQVKRADSQTLDIKPGTNGIANSAAQDTFCRGTTCLISIIYDQTGRMHLTQGPKGLWSGGGPGGIDNLASATGAPIYLGGQKVYGVYSNPGTGYRNNKPNGTAKGDEPEGIYAVLDGTHYSTLCCYDYGNAGTTNMVEGSGTMETIYFGSSKQWGWGDGKGPWIMGDLENGLFSGVSPTHNPSPTITWRFVTAIVKGDTGNHWAIRGGNAQSGSLTNIFDGKRPSGYNPMKKKGAIVLGIGGDNSPYGAGTFYEGCLTTGYPSASVENSVQANIVAAKYSVSATAKKTKRRDGGNGHHDHGLEEGASISLAFTGAKDGKTRYIAHTGLDSALNVEIINDSTDKAASAATWIVRPALALRPDCFSLESRDHSGSYIRHLRDEAFQLVLATDDGTKAFAEDATFCPEATAAAGDLKRSVHIRSWNFPKQYVRHVAGEVWAASDFGGVSKRDLSGGEFAVDAAWTVEPGLI